MCQTIVTEPAPPERSWCCAHLLGDLASAVDELLLGEAVVGTALECSSFGDQPCAAVAQLRHLLLNVRANLQTTTGRQRLAH